MHLKIKPESEAVKRFYENHSSYHEGDSGLDLFVTERITIPGKSLSFKIVNLSFFFMIKVGTDLTYLGNCLNSFLLSIFNLSISLKIL